MQASRRSKWTSSALALALAVGQGQPAFSESRPVPAAGVTRDDYEACLARDDAAFRDAIERVTVRALEASIRGLDYRPVVAEEWRRGNVDDILLKRVDSALEEIRQETSWSERLASLASKESQERLARITAEKVYHSTEVKRAIEVLAEGVGREIGGRLELATGEASELATRCLQAYLGPRYGQSVARAVAADAGRKLSLDAARGTPSVSGGRMLVEGKEGIAGLVVLIMRRQLGNLAARVGQRLVGAVLGRIVSSVAGGLGVVLIAKDIWELRNGVLPIIAAEMKAPATRDKVQAEIAEAIAAEVAGNLREIGRRTAEGVVEIWQEHRRAHAKVIDLAERNSEFRRFVDGIGADNLARLDEVIALQLASGDEAQLLRRVADGSLGEAVERWPAAALSIARDLRSLEAGFRWRALVGDVGLSKVVEHELHRRADPSEQTRAGLERILALDDKIAIARLASLKRSALEPLLEAREPDLKRLARALSETELTALAGYMTALEVPARRQLLAAVSEAPSVMQTLAPDSVRSAILASRDQTAALTIMLRREELFDVALFTRDVETLRSGAISPRVIIARYPMGLAVLAGLALLVLLILVRLVFGRRPRRLSGHAEPPAS
ncbi:MAG: hypothetical protein SFW09_23275 [Hyphomicrobiaceae bacterium]|nr:hypothetical protein [Hyphomicrobiaceae bacterium]